MDYEDRIVQILVLHEGRTLKPYQDTVGKTTIGVGRNLTDKGISAEESDLLLADDITSTEDDLRANYPTWENLDEVRKVALVDMCFNLGITRFLNFKNTLQLITDGKYELAADQMLKSVWAQQVKIRAKRLSEMIRTGKYPKELS